MIKKYADRFFRWFCHPDYYDDIRGDLDELYHKKKTMASQSWQTDLYYAKEVLLLLRLSLMRPFYFPNPLRNLIMLRIYIKTAFRNMRKNRAYALINILGLALGLAACLLVYAYTQFESGYDRMHPNAERLYRVNQTAVWNPAGGVMASTAPPVAALLKDQYSEIEAVTRVNTPGGQTVRYEQPGGQILTFNEPAVLAADSNFFDFFAFPLLEGDANTALKGTGKVVISPEMAEKYFGDEPALGKILEFGDSRFPVQVTGITTPQAEDMHFNFDFLWSMPTNPNVEQFDWSFIWTQVATYVRLSPKADPQELEGKFESLADDYVQPSFSRLGMNYKDFVADKGGWNFYLQPVKDIHLHSTDIGNRLGSIGDGQIVNLLRYVALLILVIALLNFINLSTARASTRAKEIGVKKTVGALKNSLISQFLVESITVATLATLLALLLIKLLQTAIHYLSGIDISLSILQSVGFIPVILLIPVGVGLLAGLYPAFYLSAFRPIQVLKGKLVSGIKSNGVRNVLVTAQFAISIALMAGTVLIYQQLQYLNQKNLGFNKENIIVINHAEKLGDRLESFRNEVRELPAVVNASTSMDVPARGRWEDIYEREGANIKLPISQIKIDEDFFPTLGLTLAKGRAFEEGRPADRQGLIVNETTEKMFAWEDGNAIGKKILYPGYPEELRIIGVVKDFHFQSLRENITPLMFFHIDAPMWGNQRVVTIKYHQEQEEQLLAQLEQQWQKMGPEVPFEYSYYDDELAQLYDQERSLSGLISIFTVFSLFIAIIGLIGLLAYAAEQRRKEIGIRKVLGASILQVFLLLNRQYFKLFLLALALAIPLAWPAMQNWLDSFAYGVSINLLNFVAAGVLVALLAFLSVSYLSLNAASANLADTLKDE